MRRAWLVGVFALCACAQAAGLSDLEFVDSPNTGGQGGEGASGGEGGSPTTGGSGGVADGGGGSGEGGAICGQNGPADGMGCPSLHHLRCRDV